MRPTATRFLLATIAALLLTAPSIAIKPFLIQFAAKYADGSNPEFDTTVKEAKCFVCHQGKKKKNRNAYGEALHAYLDKKRDKKDVEKILESLEKVASESSDPDTEGVPTFGELIAQGKLPGGTLDDAKQEPEPDPESESDPS